MVKYGETDMWISVLAQSAYGRATVIFYSIWYWRSILMSGYLNTLLNSFFWMISPPKIGDPPISEFTSGNLTYWASLCYF
jgi:hypothetical protein